MTEQQEPRVAVWCSLQFEGIHCWPECPFDDVSFLRDPHRHMFHIKAWRLVSHNDRDVEFIMLKREIVQYLDSMFPDGDMGSRSCEMLARELCQEFSLDRCDVSEDGENGATVVFG